MQIHATCGKGINSLAEPFMDFVQHSLLLHHCQRSARKVSANLMDLHTRLTGIKQQKQSNFTQQFKLQPMSHQSGHLPRGQGEAN